MEVLVFLLRKINIYCDTTKPWRDPIGLGKKVEDNFLPIFILCASCGNLIVTAVGEPKLSLMRSSFCQHKNLGNRS